MMKIDDRFILLKQLGQGSFSTIYSAEDKQRNGKVALKIEKPDKSKRILMFEYDVLKQLQGLSHLPEVYEFIERTNGGQNFIVMQLLGKNLATQKKLLGRKLTVDIAINYLTQMLDSIEEVHSRGYIHRDIKPSNFVIGKGPLKNKVFIVDFGLGKQHMNNGLPVQMRSQADFRGTITYASLNAHLKHDLGRRDDMWSFYFVILDFLNENLPWRDNSEKDEVKEIKMKSFNHPEKYLWTTTSKRIIQVKEIFQHIKSLSYGDKPNYELIRSKLKEIKHAYISSISQIQYHQFISGHPSQHQYGQYINGTYLIPKKQQPFTIKPLISQDQHQQYQQFAPIIAAIPQSLWKDDDNGQFLIQKQPELNQNQEQSEPLDESLLEARKLATLIQQSNQPIPYSPHVELKKQPLYYVPVQQSFNVQTPYVLSNQAKQSNQFVSSRDKLNASQISNHNAQVYSPIRQVEIQPPLHQYQNINVMKQQKQQVQPCYQIYDIKYPSQKTKHQLPPVYQLQYELPQIHNIEPQVINQGQSNNIFTKNLSVQQAQVSSATSSYNQNNFNPFQHPPYTQNQFNINQQPQYVIPLEQQVQQQNLRLVDQYQIRPSNQDNMNFNQYPQQPQVLKVLPNDFNPQNGDIDDGQHKEVQNYDERYQCEMDLHHNGNNQMLGNQVMDSINFNYLPHSLIQLPVQVQLEKKREKKLFAKHQYKEKKQQQYEHLVSIPQAYQIPPPPQNKESNNKPKINLSDNINQLLVNMYTQNVININQLNQNQIPEQHSLVSSMHKDNEKSCDKMQQIFKVEIDQEMYKKIYGNNQS